MNHSDTPFYFTPGYSMIDLLLEHGDIQEAHNVLFQENADARNAYYEQKLLIDDLEVYRRDIGKVWRIAEREVQERLQLKDSAGVPLGIFCRYPLLIASLNDWIRCIDSDLVIALVDAGLKAPSWGRFAADLTEDTTNRVEVLGMLWSHFPENVQDEVFEEIVKEFPNLSARGDLIRVIETFPPALLLKLVDTIREISIPEDWQGNRARALATLVPYLPKNKRKIILQECVEAARAIPNSLGHAISLSMVLPFLPSKKRKEILGECINCLAEGATGNDFFDWENEVFLQRLAEYVNPKLFEALLSLEKSETARDLNRDKMYSYICPYLAEKKHYFLLQDYFFAIKDDTVRTTTLVDMLPYLPVKWLSFLLIPPQTLQNLTGRQVLAATRKGIAERAQFIESQLYSILLRRVRDFESASDCIRALTGLLPYLRASEQEEVIKEIRTLIGQENRTKRIGDLIHLSYLHPVSPSQRIAFLEEALSLVRIESDDTALPALDIVCSVLLEKTDALRDHLEEFLKNHPEEGKCCLYILIDQLPPDWLPRMWDIIQASDKPDPLLRAKWISRIAELGEIDRAQACITSLLPELDTGALTPFLCALPPSVFNEDILHHLVNKIVLIREGKQASDIYRVFDLDCVTDYLPESSVNRLIEWSKTLIGNSETLPKAISNVISRLIPCYARLGRIEDAYRQIHTLNYYDDKARALVKIAQYIASSLHEEYLQEIKGYLDKAKDPENWPEYLKLFIKAFGSTRGSAVSSMFETQTDAKTLALMGKLLPMKENMQCWEELPLDYDREEWLIPLVPEMPMLVVQRALHTLANEKTDASKISYIAQLTSLLRRLRELDVLKRFEMLSSYLLECSRQKREKLVLDLSALASLFYDLGGAEAVIRLQEAARCVYRWWDQPETKQPESVEATIQEQEAAQNQDDGLREDSIPLALEQIERDLVDAPLMPLQESIILFMKHAKDGPVSEKIMGEALHTLVSVPTLPEGPQKDQLTLILQIYQDAQAAYHWFSEHLYGYRLGLYGYTLRSSVSELMYGRLQRLLEKSGFDKRAASHIVAYPGIRRWLEGYMLAMLFMELKRKQQMQGIKDDLIVLFLLYGSDFVQEQLALADAAKQYYVDRTPGDAIDRFMHPATFTEVTEERKEQIERKILDVIIDGLEKNLLKESELPIIAEFVLKKMDVITSEPELLLFFSVMEKKWQIFHDVENFEPVQTKELWLNRGDNHYDAERYDEALNAFEQALLLDPNDATAHYGKGLTLYSLQRYDEAIIAFDHAILLNPDFTPAYINKSAALLALQLYDEVILTAEQATRCDPNLALAYNNKGAALKELGLYTEAVAAFEQAIRLDPNSTIAYYNKGLALKDLQHYTEAIIAFDSALRLDPTCTQAYASKGGALLELQRYDEALEIYEQLIRLEPTDPLAYYDKGLLLSELQHYDAALAAYEQVIRLNPSKALAYNNIGHALAQLQRYDKAITACDQAIRLDPNLAIAYHTRGETLLELQRYNEALTDFEQAIRLDPTNASIYDDKGAALERLGRQNEAQQAYIRARQLRDNQ